MTMPPVRAGANPTAGPQNSANARAAGKFRKAVRRLCSIVRTLNTVCTPCPRPQSKLEDPTEDEPTPPPLPRHPAERRMSRATLYLVRHGQASFGAADYDKLSANGERQAELLGEHWQRCGFTVEAAYSGDMLRQRETGRLALQRAGLDAVAPHTDAAFNEFDHRALIHAYFPKVVLRYPEFAAEPQKALHDRKSFQILFEGVVGAWLNGEDPAAPIPETWPQFHARCSDGLRRIATGDAERIVVFTSGGVLAAVLYEALGIEATRAFRLNWRIHNASVHQFRLGSAGLDLLRYNDVAHLELLREPSLLTYR